MSLEQLSHSAQEWIQQNPLEISSDSPPAITTKRKIDQDGNFLPEGETTVPKLPGMSEKMQGFLTDFFNHGDLDALTPKQRRFMLPYISEDISIKGLAERESVIYQDAYSGIRTGLQAAFFSLPSEVRYKYKLTDIWEPKAVVNTPRPRHPNKVAVSVNPVGHRKPSPQSAAMHSLVVNKAFGTREEGYRNPTGVSHPEEPEEFGKEILDDVPPEGVITTARNRGEATMAKKDEALAKFLAKAYDMTPEEREARPMGGALFNWVFVQTLPEDLRQFYRDHPDLEVDRWKKFSTNPYDSFVSFAYGEVCYTVGGNRAFIYASTIVEHYRRDNLQADPRAFRKFAMLRWPDIQRDIEVTAIQGGYRRPIAA